MRLTRFSLFAVACSCVAGWVAMTGFAHAADRPNIIFIMADDLGYGDVSAYNPDAAVTTTHIDNLAANGMMFTNAHTPSAVCSPTRYGVLTGDHPFRANLANRVQFNYGDVWLDPDQRTIAQMLGESGYATGMVGKWHLGYDVFDSDGNRITGPTTKRDVEPDWTRGLTGGPADNGFDFTYGHPSSADIPPYKWFSNGQWVSETSAFITKAQAIEQGIADRPADDTDMRTLRNGWMDPAWDFNLIHRIEQDQAVGFIHRHAEDDEPFFLYVPLSGPHTPYVPHPDYQGKTPHNYTDFVAEVDGVVGAIYAALQAKGVLGNTLIIVTSDNGADGAGARHADHRGTGVMAGTNLRGQKADGWEGGHRVPYIVHWGDGTDTGSTIKRGIKTNEFINLVDFTRTAAALAGVKVEEGEAVDSWDMSAVLLGDGTDLHTRETQFSTSFGGAFTISRKDQAGNEWKLIFSDGSGRGFSGPKGEIINPDQDFSALDLAQLQLYNIATDPGEQANLLADEVTDAERAVAQELHATLRGYITSGTSIKASTGR